MIRYEYPLNERVRTLLRLEDLFDRLNWHVRGEHPYNHHAALATLFEIADVAARGDLKTDLLQELERQRSTLSVLRGNPDVEQARLDGVLREIDAAHAGIHRLAGRIGQNLKEDEWITSVRQRAIIPGGLCEFDLPAYHRWLHEPADSRRANLQEWTAPMMPVRSGLDIVLRLMRESCNPAMQQAINGVYQQMLEAGARPAQMIRVGVGEEFCCVPEISANKYMLNIRFVRNLPGESRVCADSMPFELTFCTL
ncbi:MAG: cell division protein ZapD [Pseudomonadota bacterium]